MATDRCQADCGRDGVTTVVDVSGWVAWLCWPCAVHACDPLAPVVPPLLLDGPAIAAELRLSAGTIRNWATAGHITRRGHDDRGRTLYDVDEVRRRAATHRASAGAGVR